MFRLILILAYLALCILGHMGVGAFIIASVVTWLAPLFLLLVGIICAGTYEVFKK